jgi:hypothetical protein
MDNSILTVDNEDLGLVINTTVFGDNNRGTLIDCTVIGKDNEYVCTGCTIKGKNPGITGKNNKIEIDEVDNGNNTNVESGKKFVDIKKENIGTVKNETSSKLDSTISSSNIKKENKQDNETAITLKTNSLPGGAAHVGSVDNVNINQTKSNTSLFFVPSLFISISQTTVHTFSNRNSNSTFFVGSGLGVNTGVAVITNNGVTVSEKGSRKRKASKIKEERTVKKSRK